ncbi:transcriptional regulator family: HMG [Penicillium tannophilum]|nr:transcriptional regulator family: HMG [Penicillium tannophilum]
MATEFSPDWPAVVVLLFAYLTTIPFWRATRILSLWNPHSHTLSHFALNIISGIPYNFFLRPLTIPLEPHYVIQNGRFFFDPHMNPQQAQIMPGELEHYVREWGPVGMPTERPKKRTKTLNSFMAFRAFLAPLFPDIPQSSKSPLIGHMWVGDPLKPQWQVLSEAYSQLREHFELEDQRLSSFIGVTKGLFNIPDPEAYLIHIGWKITEGLGDSFDVLRTLPRQQFTLPPTPVTIYEVIDHCVNNIHGYTAGQKRDSMWPSSLRERTTLMAVHSSGESVDPLYWLFNDEGFIQDGPYEEFSLEDMYDEPDPNMDPLSDLVFTPSFELFMLENKDRRENATIADIAPGFPYFENWESFINIGKNRSA